MDSLLTLSIISTVLCATLIKWRSIHLLVVRKRLLQVMAVPDHYHTCLIDPHGIYVDINFDLYVADSGNNRIQLFRSGDLNGITLAGNGAPGTITLRYPTAVVLDNDGYLFIVDSGNNRIVGSGLNGFRCLVGCSGTSGSESNQLSWPKSMAFDSYGNMFVADTGNSRIQKFLLNSNSCI